MAISAIALDLGEKRIGVAISGIDAALPRPLTTLENGPKFTDDLRALIDEREVGIIVVGLPRSLSGDDTSQTRYTRDFVENLKTAVDVPVFTIDEAGTSAKAKEELQQKNKPYAKGDIDALAAAYILEDFFATHKADIDRIKGDD